MARITIEDCTEKVPNRFHLVKMASIRTKQLKKGAQPLVGGEDNKEVVVSLREIAAGFVKPDYPEESDDVTMLNLAGGSEDEPASDGIEADPDS